MSIKAFNRWDVEGITVIDPGLKRYITLTPKIVPKTGARYAQSRFHKSRIFIVERLINKIMTPGHKGKKHFIGSGRCTGKSSKAYSTVEKAFEIMETHTKENPIKVLVKAIENASPREEIVTIEYGGARYPKAVECSPQRRIDIALRYMTQGAYSKAFNTKRKIEATLAEEIINAFKMSTNSNAIQKKIDVERQADSSR